jgi:nucleoside-diphosphate-sugar epimerase
MPVELHVIFGTGGLGKWTARALVEMGHSVRMVNRSGKVDRLPGGVEVVASDAADVRRNIVFTEGAAAVYQCAQPQYDEWVEKFPPLQRAILEAASVNGARLVVGDNLYMYGYPNQQPFNEDASIQPNTKKGRVRAAMAAEVIEAHEKGRVRVAIGRASDFFGPDDTDLTGYAILPAVQGKAVNLLGCVDQPHTFTYLPDFGRMLAVLGCRSEALGQVWFAPSNPPLTQAEFVDLIAAELGKPVKKLVGGPMMIRFLGLFNKEMRETVEMMFEWMNPYVIDSSKVTRAFGLQPTPMREAVRATLQWCKQRA